MSGRKIDLTLSYKIMKKKKMIMCKIVKDEKLMLANPRAAKNIVHSIFLVNIYKKQTQNKRMKKKITIAIESDILSNTWCACSLRIPNLSLHTLITR